MDLQNVWQIWDDLYSTLNSTQIKSVTPFLKRMDGLRILVGCVNWNTELCSPCFSVQRRDNHTVIALMYHSLQVNHEIKMPA